MATSSNGSDRAPFSSVLALLAAVTIGAFTWGSIGSVSVLHWSMWLVVGWSYAMALALIVWAVRDWLGIHWIGNPTLSMVAGASGSSIAAVALAFTFASAKDQDLKVAEQKQLLEAQLQVLGRIEKLLSRNELSLPVQSSSPVSQQPSSTGK
jgi:hypothetical protein